MKLKNKPLPKSKIQSKPIDWGIAKSAKVVNVPQPTATTTNKPAIVLNHKSTALVSNADFVKAWMTCKTNAEVAKQLGLTKEQTSSKATSLRKKGVNLPKKLAHMIDPNSVDALNKIVKRYSK